VVGSINNGPILEQYVAESVVANHEIELTHVALRDVEIARIKADFTGLFGVLKRNTRG